MGAGCGGGKGDGVAALDWVDDSGVGDGVAAEQLRGNQVMARLKLAKHPDKTFIGRIAKGFDWLGYHLSPGCLSVACKTLARFLARVRLLYEHDADANRIGAYGRRWWIQRAWAFPLWEAG